jgi:hypothetical protein
MMDTLPELSEHFSAFTRDLKRRIREFLPRNAGRLTRLSQAVMQTTVYDVYDPKVYERTFRLKKSMRAHLPDQANTKVMYIESAWEGYTFNAHAKLSPGGYAKYVAGEGPGIGFLVRTVPSEFPRDFPGAIFMAVEADILPRFETEVVDKALAKL